LTAGLRVPFQPSVAAGDRYAHVEWTEILDLVAETWSGDIDIDTRKVASTLLVAISHLAERPDDWWDLLGYPPSEPPAPLALSTSPTAPIAEYATGPIEVEIMDTAVELAEATGLDGRQRAFGVEYGGLEMLDATRLALRRLCRGAADGSPLREVQPWLWSSASSGGTAMTPAGKATGFEVRLSRSRATRAP
jgi:hypothetical protein